MSQENKVCCRINLMLTACYYVTFFGKSSWHLPFHICYHGLALPWPMLFYFTPLNWIFRVNCLYEIFFFFSQLGNCKLNTTIGSLLVMMTNFGIFLMALLSNKFIYLAWISPSNPSWLYTLFRQYPVYLSWGFQSCCSVESLAGFSEVPGGGHLLPTAQSLRPVAPHTLTQLWLPSAQWGSWAQTWRPAVPACLET